jgi:hypothetical protein
VLLLLLLLLLLRPVLLSSVCLGVVWITSFDVGVRWH